MDKKKLRAVSIEDATEDMIALAEKQDEIRHIVTASLIEDKKILLLYFYDVKRLKNGNTKAGFRTFLSRDDYITQDLRVSKTKWLTASFDMMNDICFARSYWNYEKDSWDTVLHTITRSADEKLLIEDFFREYANAKDECSPWTRIHRFQKEVKARRLAVKHKKETDIIDEVMAPIKEPPKEFFDWCFESGMSFSRYLIYKEELRGTATCLCTHCKKKGIVDRKSIRLRNNEIGTCPFCGSRVKFKAKGKMPARSTDERWFAYVDPTEQGFIFRYFYAVRELRSENYLVGCTDKSMVRESIHEYSRAIYTFRNGIPSIKSYEWAVYKGSGKTRWCNDEGKIACMECIIYPGNLPDAWAHTPLKYSGLEVLARNAPTFSMRYEDGIMVYLKYPKLEWICKMGLNQIARSLINERYAGRGVGQLNLERDTIFNILGLTKVNTRILQAIDGNRYHLRLLQVSQQIGMQFTAEQLKDFYDTFECNTELLKSTNRKASLHKLVRYISKESEHYPAGEKGCWHSYSFMRYQERKDPRIERKQNMAKDWLEYIGWCKELGYDLDNMFVYMPKNFKAVHDRTAAEYQEMKDKKAAAEKKRREKAAKKKMEQTRKAMEEIFSYCEGIDAFAIKGKGLILVVPKDGDEIRKEGAALHHCVGTYVERVAKGETSIFFIRKEEEPEKPYFTLEWKDNHIVQCRGRNNCGMPPDVDAFTKVFEKKMLASIKKKEEEHGKTNCA